MTDSNDQVDYGPLNALIGTWVGDKGLDIAPEPDGREQNPFHETITFEASGDVTNAESQHLAVLRYHQVVRRNADNEVFHNETGYWIWDAERQTVMQTLTIPRGVSLIAGGTYHGDASNTDIHPDSGVELDVGAIADDADGGIVQSPFMRDNAKTRSFSHHVSVNGNQMTYSETTIVDIYGRQFEHTDENVLHRA
jgi:hypothetical protein